MSTWEKCVDFLKGELAPSEFNTWIIPLQASEEGGRLRLFAPNRFVKDWVQKSYLERMLDLCKRLSQGEVQELNLEIGSLRGSAESSSKGGGANHTGTLTLGDNNGLNLRGESNLNPEFTFDTFVEGKSNQIARAVAIQIGQNPGSAYNPLFIYGGVGLGKTHLMHAVGNEVLNSNPSARVVYLHSDRFVGEMVKALQHNRIDEFKKRYRYVNALLIDDVQFFSQKEPGAELCSKIF